MEDNNEKKITSTSVSVFIEFLIYHIKVNAIHIVAIFLLTFIVGAMLQLSELVAVNVKAAPAISAFEGGYYVEADIGYFLTKNFETDENMSGVQLIRTKYYEAMYEALEKHNMQGQYAVMPYGVYHEEESSRVFFSMDEESFTQYKWRYKYGQGFSDNVDEVISFNVDDKVGDTVVAYVGGEKYTFTVVGVFAQGQLYGNNKRITGIKMASNFVLERDEDCYLINPKHTLNQATNVVIHGGFFLKKSDSVEQFLSDIEEFSNIYGFDRYCNYRDMKIGGVLWLIVLVVAIVLYFVCTFKYVRESYVKFYNDYITLYVCGLKDSVYMRLFTIYLLPFILLAGYLGVDTVAKCVYKSTNVMVFLIVIFLLSQVALLIWLKVFCAKQELFLCGFDDVDLSKVDGRCPLVGTYTSVENVALIYRIKYKMDRKMATYKAQQVLKILALDRIGQLNCDTLSYLQRLQIMIARAYVYSGETVEVEESVTEKLSEVDIRVIEVLFSRIEECKLNIV